MRNYEIEPTTPVVIRITDETKMPTKAIVKAMREGRDVLVQNKNGDTIREFVIPSFYNY